MVYLARASLLHVQASCTCKIPLARARYTRRRAQGGTCMGASDEPNAASPSSVESSILVCPARPPPVTLPPPPPSPLKTLQHQNGPASEGGSRADLPDHSRRERRVQPRALHLREPCLARKVVIKVIKAAQSPLCRHSNSPLPPTRLLPTRPPTVPSRSASRPCNNTSDSRITEVTLATQSDHGSNS